jgi:protein-tyrosine phosphatase
LFMITSGLGTAGFEDGPDAIPPGVDIVDVRDLIDDGGTQDVEPIVRDIDIALKCLEDGRCCIRCQHGISRSNAVAAAVIAAGKGIDYAAALRMVEAAVKRAHPKPGILAACQRALEAWRNSPEQREHEESLEENYLPDCRPSEYVGLDSKMLYWDEEYTPQ